jgi:hypothetical protein
MAWLERAVREPDWTEPDPDDATLERRFRSIPEFGNRHLRAVCRELPDATLIVTVFFDRKARRP